LKIVGEEQEGACPRTDCVERGGVGAYYSIPNFCGGLYTSVGLSEYKYNTGTLIYAHTLTAYQVSCNVHWLFVSLDADPNFELLFTTQDDAFLISGNISKNGNFFEKEISICANVI
jgi:hypothetical protein